MAVPAVRMRMYAVSAQRTSRHQWDVWSVATVSLALLSRGLA
jgi:hypothetical protein